MSLHRVKLSALIYGQTHQNVLHFANPDGALTDQEIALLIRDNWINNVKSEVTDDLIWNQISVKNLGSQVAEYSLTIAIPGGQGTSIKEAPTLCFVLQLKTALAGRHGHGRVYQSGVHPTRQLSGIITNEQLILWTNKLTLVKAALCTPNPTTGLTMVVNRQGNVLESGGTPVTDIVVRSSLGVQRRRNYGVGV